MENTEVDLGSPPGYLSRGVAVMRRGSARRVQLQFVGRCGDYGSDGAVAVMGAENASSKFGTLFLNAQVVIIF